jgi:hypothetical protein
MRPIELEPITLADAVRDYVHDCEHLKNLAPAA